MSLLFYAAVPCSFVAGYLVALLVRDRGVAAARRQTSQVMAKETKQATLRVEAELQQFERRHASYPPLVVR